MPKSLISFPLSLSHPVTPPLLPSNSLTHFHFLFTSSYSGNKICLCSHLFISFYFFLPPSLSCCLNPLFPLCLSILSSYPSPYFTFSLSSFWILFVSHFHDCFASIPPFLSLCHHLPPRLLPEPLPPSLILSFLPSLL